MAVRAKFKLSEVHHYEGEQQKFVFRPVCDNKTPENERFQKYTPSGDLWMLVTNPLIHTQFKVGSEYYLDFSEVPKE